jgi:hypothetical protein
MYIKLSTKLREKNASIGETLDMGSFTDLEGAHQNL